MGRDSLSSFNLAWLSCSMVVPRWRSITNIDCPLDQSQVIILLTQLKNGKLDVTLGLLDLSSQLKDSLVSVLPLQFPLLESLRDLGIIVMALLDLALELFVLKVHVFILVLVHLYLFIELASLFIDSILGLSLLVEDVLHAFLSPGVALLLLLQLMQDVARDSVYVHL